jgi:hypothetical protein
MRIGISNIVFNPTFIRISGKVPSAAAEQMELSVFPKYISPVQSGAKASPGKHYMK